MQEENTTATESQSAADSKHYFYEVGRELLSKPNLLCDIVESAAAFPIVVYCNTPSDTDFVEVMLRKRGITAQKLIGNVPQPKLESAVEQVKNQQLSVIVLTDIAARMLDLSMFNLAINYSVPQDADIYQERTGAAKGTLIGKILTLVTPLELANFHYLKKSLGYEPELAEAPSEDLIAKMRLKNLAVQAERENLLQNEKIKTLVSLVSSDEKRDEIIALLVHNTFTVLPAAKATAAKAAEVREEEDDDDGYQQPRGDRDDRRQGGRGRNDRRDRDGNRGGRSDDRSGSYGARGRDSDDGYDNGDEDENFGNRAQDSKRGQRNRRDNRDREDRPRNDQPLKKDARIYLGVGSAEGIDKERILNTLKEPCNITEEDIKHFSCRTHYTFFDIDDEKSAAAMDALKEAGIAKDNNPYTAKAITINAVVPKAEVEESAESVASDSGAEEGSINEDSGYEEAEA